MLGIGFLASPRLPSGGQVEITSFCNFLRVHQFLIQKICVYPPEADSSASEMGFLTFFSTTWDIESQVAFLK